MEINKKRYKDLDSFFKRKFHKKVIKLPLDGGFTCPNRDGTLSSLGCIYCSDSGSGEWTFREKGSISQQISYQKKLLSKPGRDEAYIAYFQNFTNTYGDVEKMREMFYEAISQDDIVGLFIATRADCLSDEVLELLDELNKKTFLVVELGMQSVNEKTISLINRGYRHEEFDKGLLKLKNLGINILVHIIVGLPYEDMGDYLADISYINSRKIWGVKIHNLYIEKGTRLLDFYEKEDIAYTMDKDSYVEILLEMLRRLDPNVVINRLTGDGLREKIAYPVRSKNKGKILATIDRMMKVKDYRQGDLWKEN